MPGPTVQTDLYGKVVHPLNVYKTNSNRNTTSAASTNTASTANAGNSASNNNASNRAAEEEEAMIVSTLQYNHMKGNTTNSGYKSAIRWYDIYKATDANLSVQYPTLDALTPPKSVEEHAEFYEIMKGFADYLVIHARKAGTTENLEPGTAKGYFRNVIGYLKTIPVWSNFTSPAWYGQFAESIEKALTLIKATNGDLVNTKTAKETKIGRKVFKEMIFELLKKATPNKQAKLWSMM